MRRLMLVATVILMGISGYVIAADQGGVSLPPKAKLQSAPQGEFAPVVPATVAPSGVVIRDSGGVSTASSIRKAPISGDYVKGSDKAPLLMIEYVSMTCPHCAHFSNTVLPELEKKYIETGKMAYILRQFPLNEPALKAAMLLVCIGDQNVDKYYVFSKVLFEAQNKWAFDEKYLANLETIAAVGGISKPQFENCIGSTDREMKVLKAKQVASEEVKVPHTPYIFIGGEIYAGERTVEDVSRFIDAKLAQVTR